VCHCHYNRCNTVSFLVESEIPDSLTRYQVALRSHLENVDELIGKLLSRVVVLHPLRFISD